MTLGGYITLLASVAGLGTASALQDPTFESPTFSPAFAPEVSQDGAATTQGTAVKADTTRTWVTQSQKTVSVTFTGASAREVVDWLTKQGVSFMVADSDLPTDRKISMNIVNQPVENVVNALATALGGHWERRDGILVFRNGAGFGGLTFSQPREPKGVAEPRMGLMPSGPQGLMSSKDWEEFNKSLQQKYRGRGGMYLPSQGFEFKKFDLEPFMKMSQDERKQTEELRKQIEKEAKAGKFKGLNKDFMNQGDMEKLQREMKMELGDVKNAEKMAREMHEKLLKQGKDGQFFMDAKAAEKMAKEMQEKFGKPGKNGQPFMDAKAAEKMAKEMQDKFGKSGNWVKPGDFAPLNMELGGQDLQALVKSLTPQQRDKQKHQGFLRLSDLTPSQRRYLGRMGSDGDWTLKYKNGSDELTIKSDRASR